MTKIQLLQNVSEEEIIKKYLQKANGEIFNPESSKNYRSPFAQKDDHPSLSFYREGDGWKFKSHNTGHGGDVFQFVADLYKLNCRENFQGIIEFIAKDFKLNGYALPSKKSVTISFEKEYTPAFAGYFQQYRISTEVLHLFGVKQVKYHEFYSGTGKLCKFDYRKLSKVAVCYNVNGHLKIYFPAIEGVQEKTFGFKDQTSEDVFGLAQLQPTDRLFIAAGEKDCLALNAAGFPSIAFQSENHLPTKAQIEAVQAKAKKVFLVYDNDEAGIKAANKIITATDWRRVTLPEGYKDAADFFRKCGREDFEPLIHAATTKGFKKVGEVNEEESPNEPPDEEEEDEAYTVFHATESYLNKHYDLRFNTISLELEISYKGRSAYNVLNENDLYVELNKKGIKVGMDKLIAILKSSFVKRYNPIKEYFTGLPAWNGSTDTIALLASHLKTEDEAELLLQFKKWLVRCVRCAMEEGYYNKQAFILVHSKQNSGKTTFCRFLCPPALKDYLAENISDDKDSKIAIAKNFLINLDELSSLAKHEINSLKALFSKDVINERLPYDRKNSIIHRVASFIGSTNMAEFLTDETGSVRWLCFEIRSIDWHYRQAVSIDAVWSQAYALYASGFDAEMTPADIARNEERNSKFQQLSTEAELVPKYLKPSDNRDAYAEFMTATDIIMYLGQFTTLKLNKVMIGRAMPSIGFRRVKDNLTDRYGYYCLKLQ